MSSTAVVTRASRYGRFRPYRLRATGGFSDVYLARDNAGTTVALKVFRSMSSDTSRSMERFRREKLILERVGSRRVARLIDADLDAVPPWIASEFIDGPTLREAVSQVGSFGIDLAVSVLSLLSETLTEIHDLGIAHRDLNPNNIILSTNGPTLIDFGSAQLLATDQANFSQLSVGTPGYISPEQLNGEPATLASDIYSFGKIASFLVTGDATDQGRRGLALFPPSQEEILRRCLSEDPLMRPSARDLQAAFASRENPVAEILKLDYRAPELRKIPRGRTPALLLFFGVCVLTVGSIGVWRVTNSSELTTLDLVSRLAESYERYQKPPAELTARSDEFGVIKTISLPPEVEMFRERRNFSKKDFGFLDFFRLYREDAISSELVVYALPSFDPPSFKDLVGLETTPRLADLSGFGAGISDRVAQFQSEFVYAECALDVPETVLTDAVLGRIRHVAAAPVCLELLGTTQVAFAVHDWYPNRNLLFELTGWVDISVINPIQLLNSLELSESPTSPIARPTASLGLTDLSIYRERPSLIDANDADAAYFYANVFVEIPPLSSLELKISAPEESAAQFSFTAYRRETASEAIEEFPAGRLWAVDEHQIQFDNPDTTPLVLSFEIDSSDTTPPEILVSAEQNAAGEGWLTASTLSLGIGELSSSLDEELRFLLPSLMDPAALVTTRSSVGSLEIPVPSMWKPTTNEALAQAGFREFWPIVDTELRESDLPHLQVTTEEFSRQVDGSDGLIWVADTAFLSCRTPTTFAYSNDRTVEWSVFRSCEIPDALQGNFSRQIQASMIIKFVVHDGVKDDRNESSIVYRGVFVPGSHQDLDYLKSLFEYLASESL